MTEAPAPAEPSPHHLRRSETAARGVTPVGFAVAILCFFFTFNAVSCNTDAAKQTLHTAAGITGSPTGTAAVDSCLDALNSVSLFSYTGIDLAFGSAPEALTTIPTACRNSQQGLTPSASPPRPAQAALGVQALALLAFVACCLGLLIGVALLVWPRRARPVLPAAALLAVAALVALTIDQSRVQGAVLTRIDALAAGSGAPFSLAGYFTQRSGIAFFLALVALGLVAITALGHWVMASRPPAHAIRAPD
ncbi:MAG: hypothetical protein JOZ46_08210 [Candidatus Dormibacteraeota bacterium]|nr:hypothetical protein [Candidatus Dormibacteraeota bacterium]MBV9525782.1 hypothetical protein [Candidatus Dormibacteraeota bacterium]